MTANDDTPTVGQESIDIGTESFPLQESTDEDLAAELEQQQKELVEAADAVERSLRDESVPLTDAKVWRLSVAAEAVNGITRTLSLRVPEEYRIEEDR